MKVWLTTDTHFRHRKMIVKGYRPADFEERIITQWNDVVRDTDLVIHLGDVIVGQDKELEMILFRLRGRKILVRGNHDNETVTWYMERGFDFACDSFTWNRILFTHEPAAVLPAGCDLNIHGHLHSDGHRSAEYNLQTWNVLLSLEDPKVDYRPVLLNPFASPHLNRELAAHPPFGSHPPRALDRRDHASV